MGAIVGGVIGGSILICILFIAIPLCICCCKSAGKTSSHNQGIGLATTAVHPPHTAAALVAETKLVSTQQQVPPPSFIDNTNVTLAYPATGYVQQPLPPPSDPPPAYPATGYALFENVPQQPQQIYPTEQMGYPPVGYPVQGYGYLPPVGYPVQGGYHPAGGPYGP